MTGDNGLRDEVADVIALTYRTGAAHATARAVLALPAIREALAAVAQRDAALLIHVPNGNVLARCAHDARLWPCPTVRALEAGSATVPRCQHLSPSPWGTAQCVLPDGHDERHGYSPSEALR